MRAHEAIRPEEGGLGGHVFGLSGQEVGRPVTETAVAAGLESGFSAYSGRVGLTAELSCAGASTHDTSAAGGWMSVGMVIRYTCRETARRGLSPDTSRAGRNRRSNSSVSNSGSIGDHGIFLN